MSNIKNDIHTSDEDRVYALQEYILQSLADNKAEDVLSIPVAHKTSLGRVFVLASGRSRRHVATISEHLLRDLKKKRVKNLHAEGMTRCDWVLIDAGAILIHIFRPEVRAYYKLEELWLDES